MSLRSAGDKKKRGMRREDLGDHGKPLAVRAGGQGGEQGAGEWVEGGKALGRDLAKKPFKKPWAGMEKNTGLYTVGFIHIV